MGKEYTVNLAVLINCHLSPLDKIAMVRFILFTTKYHRPKEEHLLGRCNQGGF